jgi:hypothetical protein
MDRLWKSPFLTDVETARGAKTSTGKENWGICLQTNMVVTINGAEKEDPAVQKRRFSENP